ncbi:glycosyltransferase family 4 protein [Marinobacter sp. M216]|uniref:Glycosyltransferase family 4 protein n=1 Tax=Marinobacter albus TaxID=3030833 RepID=A0ABT7HA92_9GAMM|nr:glycosyltransferase family 4 protein [Marinobacter sp. M216]MDK9557291.1 glycosyltransferase family 4 protein [Marinobacter sp. M216]
MARWNIGYDSMSSKVLINLPSLALPGGVSNHYRGLQPYWRQEVFYNFTGGRHGLPGPIVLIFDYIKFLFLCITRRYKTVVLNPSLGRTAILRDAMFLRLAKFFRLKVIVFFHGWDPAMEKIINSNPDFFRRKFGRANSFIVLASEFSDKLNSWGLERPVYLSTTKVYDRLVEGFDIERKVYGKTILFLARLEPNKGILLALDAFSKVLVTIPDARFVVAGSGSARESAIEFVRSRSIPNVEFLGNVSGGTLVKTFRTSDIYLLPTMHGEGMPTSVLEAMAFGLPVVTRPVGGLKDFFQDEKMGFSSDSLESQFYADALIKLLSAPEKMKKIGRFNHDYAKEHFLASKVARQLEEIMERD